MNHTRRTKLILIAGQSASGKTTVTRKLLQRLNCTALSLDDYYKDYPTLTLIERGKLNYDQPDAIDFALLEQHIEALITGLTIQKPSYNFAEHRRMTVSTSLTIDSKYLILEGLFSLCNSFLREQALLKIYVDTPPEICLERRTMRDIAERGRSAESVLERWNRYVLPGYRNHILPTLGFADLVVNGLDIASDTEIDRIAAAIESKA